MLDVGWIGRRWMTTVARARFGWGCCRAGCASAKASPPSRRGSCATQHSPQLSFTVQHHGTEATGPSQACPLAFAFHSDATRSITHHPRRAWSARNMHHHLWLAAAATSTTVQHSHQHTGRQPRIHPVQLSASDIRAPNQRARKSSRSVTREPLARPPQ